MQKLIFVTAKDQRPDGGRISEALASFLDIVDDQALMQQSFRVKKAIGEEVRRRFSDLMNGEVDGAIDRGLVKSAVDIGGELTPEETTALVSTVVDVVATAFNTANSTFSVPTAFLIEDVLASLDFRL